MSWLLAIDCSDRACSVALGNGAQVLEEYTDEPRQHAQKVLPMARSLFAEAGLEKSQLDAIAVAIGPGSFTGLRIALSIAQGLAYGLSKPLVTVSSIAALAARYKSLSLSETEESDLFVGLDARMGEVYCASFAVQGQQIQRQTKDLLLSQGAALDMAKTCQYGLGSGLGLDQFSSAGFLDSDSAQQIHAEDVYHLGREAFERGDIVSPTKVEPAYLRRENAWKKLDQQ